MGKILKHKISKLSNLRSLLTVENNTYSLIASLNSNDIEEQA